MVASGCQAIPTTGLARRSAQWHRPSATRQQPHRLVVADAGQQRAIGGECAPLDPAGMPGQHRIFGAVADLP